MSTAAKTKHAAALAEAIDFRALFEGTYERWEFAGSLRRRRPEVGDIEHVIIPNWQPEEECLLLGEVADIPHVNLVRKRATQLVAAGVLVWHDYRSLSSQPPHYRRGDKHCGVDFRGRPHELYMCEADNWGCILAIRTGSAEFSKALVTRLHQFGHRQDMGYLFRRAPKHDSDKGHAYDRIPCPDEDTYFRAAGLNVADWPPEKREETP